MMNTVKEPETWEVIKKFYSEKFGIEPSLVELASVLDILKMCASGAGNRTIGEFFNESPDYLADLFDKYLGFRGWQNDLSFSPFRYYKEWGCPDITTFTNNVITRFGYSLVIKEMYNSCVVVDRLERLLNEKWI